MVPPAPKPAPSVGAICDVPNAPARVAFLVDAKYPKSEIGSGRTPTVDVKVDVDEHGEVYHSDIAQSSGSKVFDDAAMESAVRSSYSAPIQNCSPVAGTYMLHVDFSNAK